jgi:hypothetical protein
MALRDNGFLETCPKNKSGQVFAIVLWKLLPDLSYHGRMGLDIIKRIFNRREPVIPALFCFLDKYIFYPEKE